MELGIKIMKAKQEDILIAEFMGWSYLHEINEFQDLVGQKFHKEVYYSTSWSWLMPVIEKIEMLDYTFEKNYQRVDNDWQSLIVKGNDILFQEFNIDSIKSSYYVVVEFIKWHNENK